MGAEAVPSPAGIPAAAAEDGTGGPAGPASRRCTAHSGRPARR